MITVLLALAQTIAAPVDPQEARYVRCVALARTDPAAARTEAADWSNAGGGARARGCAGLAHAGQADWPAAAAAFADGAREAEIAHDGRAADYWAQAGNAWLAGGRTEEARRALDAALAAGTLTGASLGEAQLDRARALVAGGEADAARVDLDGAVTNAPDDPLAWLLSATLARRAGDIPRARKDIAEALRRSPDDASVRLEAGNIAALAREDAGARAAWAEAARIAPDAAAGHAAVAALAQFGATPAK